jgi:23S rRNA pseudouridine2605 synthase
LRLLERERTLHQAAKDEARAQQDAATVRPAAPRSFDRPSAPRGGPGGERGRPDRGAPREGKPFRDSRGPRDAGARDSRGPRDSSRPPRSGPPRSGPPRSADRRPSRDAGSRPPRRDRP